MTELFNKNFKLLRATIFFQAIVFWYPIFIPFAYSIDLTPSLVAMSIVAVNVAILLFEVPSGFLADHWSRRGVIALSALFMVAASLIYGFSTEPAHYILASFVWGIAYASESGAYDAIIYDMLKLEGKTDMFKKYLSKILLTNSSALVIGSIVGSLIASYLSFQAAFFVTIIPAALSMVPLAFVVEPKLHAKELGFSYLKQFKTVVGYLSEHRQQLQITLLLITISASIGFLFELNQAYYFAAGVPLAFYGVLQASLQLSIGVGAWIGSLGKTRLILHASWVSLVILAVAIMLGASITTAILLSLIMVTMYTISTIYQHYLQDRITSDVRASTISVIGTAGRLLFTGLILIYGAASSSETDISGFWVFSISLALIALLILTTFRFISPKTLEPAN